MRRAALALTLLLVAACSSEGTSPAPPSLAAGEYRLELSQDLHTASLYRRAELLVAIPTGAVELGIVRELDDELSYDPYWLEATAGALGGGEPPEGLRFVPVTGVSVASAGATSLELALSFSGGHAAALTFAAAAEGRFTATLTPRPSGAAVAFVRFRAAVDPAEAFYGLGEHEDDVNQRGKLRPMQLEADLALEGASNEAHVPIPLLIGTRGWGLFVESRRVGVFDVATKAADRVTVTYGQPDPLTFHLFGAEHPLDVTRRYYDVTGDPLLPAEWAYGPLIWRDESRDQAEVEDDIRQIRALDLATSGIWIDRPYASAVNTFDFDPARYTDPARMIRRAHDAGLRVALWHVPYLEDTAQPYLSEAEDRRYHPPITGTLLNQWGKPIDFTNPAAFSWWQGLVRRYTAMGIEGFKLDYAEDLVPGIAGARNPWLFADGSTERTMHYDYTLLYHRLYAETLPSSGGFLLCRTGRWGDQKNVSVIWPGDMDASFIRHRERGTERGKEYLAVGGLPATVIQGLGLGPSGFPFFGADTGGYRHSPPKKEVYIRWFEQTALSTIMQVGDSSSQPPWVMNAENGRDAETLDLYRVYARLHLRLFPYVWSYAKRLAADGRAIQRPLGLAYPELGLHPNDTYLLGDHLLVSPVVEEGARAKDVPFPPGTWIDWWTGRAVEGGATRRVEAPLGVLPLFLKSGGIVPMLRPSIDTLAPVASATVADSYATAAGPLHLRIAPGPASAFAMFDGSTIAQDGASVTWTPGTTFGGPVHLELVGLSAAPAAIELDGGAAVTRADDPAAYEAAPAPAWRFDAPSTVHVKLSGAARVRLK